MIPFAFHFIKNQKKNRVFKREGKKRNIQVSPGYRRIWELVRCDDLSLAQGLCLVNARVMSAGVELL